MTPPQASKSIGGTPWLPWLSPTLGEAGASYLLGAVETVQPGLKLSRARIADGTH